jgi:purine nucleosidase
VVAVVASMTTDETRVIVDTDTAGDDALALLLAARSDRLTLDAVTVVAGNVPFDYEVENAKYALELAGAGDVPVYEGAREPLLKEFEHADYVHGEGGLGGDLFPDTGIESADGHGAEVIARTARENPGEVTLLCIGPLTNVSLAHALEPDLPDLVDEVWVMGGAANTVGNVTPAAEYNFWVDPDAAKRVLGAFDTHLVDWGVCVRDGIIEGAEIDALAEAGTPYADLFAAIAEPVREFTADQLGVDATTQPDSLAVAAAAYPGLVTETGTYHVAVDPRVGMTRGYSLVDELGVTDGERRTRVVESVDSEGFAAVFGALVRHGDPDRAAPDG